MGGDIQKLVRDLIPNLLTSEDRHNRMRRAQPEEMSRLLGLKYAEESGELQQEIQAADKARIIDEMADVLEAMDAIRLHFSISSEEINERQKAKRQQRGGFNNQTVLTVPLQDQTSRWHMSHVGPVVPFLNRHILQSKYIRIAVSFILESGLKLLIDAFRQALANGSKIEILTSRYLNVTEPEALRNLLALDHPNLSIRLYDRAGKSFHAKTWLFTGKDDRSTALVGSSNISWMALNHGVEWNYHIHETDYGWPVHEALQHFQDLFTHPSTVALDSTLIDDYEQTREPVFTFNQEPIYEKETPNPAQREALQRLQKLRNEGGRRAMVIAATGLGKTWLAAFDSETFERVLFVAHRKELLEQAERTFRKLRPHDSIGRLYAGESGHSDDLVFASMQTLGSDKWLEQIDPDTFDYIVIDEFHHAGSRNYLKILQRFKPQFLLGLTATPYRSDYCDLLELCDGNVAYRINLHEAIGLGWLCPFRYFGVDDNVDYSKLKLYNGEYRISDLESLLINAQRNADILRHFKNHPSRCAVGFCASIPHANNMAQFFREHGVNANALHSDEKTADVDALPKLRRGEIDVLFAVDMLNEGVDVPEIDLVMFLRPTQSVTVFLQQLGRGLRLHDRKSHLTVLDFISNYKSADFKLPALVGDLPDDTLSQNRAVLKQLQSNDCKLTVGDYIQIELEALALEKLLKTKPDPINESLIHAFKQVKTELGRQPGMWDIFQYGRYRPRTYIQVFNTDTGGRNRGESTAKNWFSALAKAGLSEQSEQQLNQEFGYLLSTVESTQMTRCYKMVILKALIDKRALYRGLSLEELASEFRAFYRSHPIARMEMSEGDLEKLELTQTKALRTLLLNMPISKWEQSHFQYSQTQDRWRCVSISNDPPEELYAALADRVRYRLDLHLERFDLALARFKIVCGQNQSDAPHIQIDKLRLYGAKPEGWHKVEINESVYYMKFASRAVNVIKTKPENDQATPNVLSSVLCDLLCVSDRQDLNGKYVSIEPNASGDGFVMTRYRPPQREAA